MTKKVTTPRLDDVFVSLRAQLPHRYMADLNKLLPDLESKKIWYAMEVRCQDLELKERVKDAMSKLVQNNKERWQNLTRSSMK